MITINDYVRCYYKMALSLLTLSSALLPSLASSSASHSNYPPRVPIQQIRSALSSNNRSGINLHQVLFDSHGIIRIALDGDNNDAGHHGGSFSALRKRALSHLCDCPTFRSSSSPSITSPARGRGAVTFEEALQSHPKDLQEITLPDGTVRRTLASATIVFDGHHDNENVIGEGRSAAALELPSWVQENCGRDAYDSLETLRDSVADAVDLFVEVLDQESKLSKGRSYQQILSSADHLEHFHVYTKSSTSPSPPQARNDEGGLRDIGGARIKNGESSGHAKLEEETYTLDYHTDAGFFLSFVPAMNCGSYTTDTSSFYLEGQSEPMAFEEDEVVIMLGAGAQYWLPPTSGDLQKQYPFLAASHALRLSSDTHRTWYGKMHLLPSSFTASNVDPRSPAVKFGEVLPSFQMEDYNAHVPTSPVDGCGMSTFDKNSLSTLSPATTVQKKSGRRRLQHVNSPATCNNQTNFFCWYQCIDIPSSDNAEIYVQGGYSLYCLEPGKLSSSDTSISDATEPCEDGYVHNSNCIGSWQVTDENIAGYKLPYEAKKAEPENESNQTASEFLVPDIDTGDKYCYGGTSMYMDGFTWQGSTCVIYLFESWLLSTPGKFAAAAIGSILFGVLLEFVLWKRRSVYAMAPGVGRLCISALVYGIQLSMGYFIMLVVMIYSGPLFICTVGGMMLGHMCFNAQDSFVKKWEEKASRSADEDETPAYSGKVESSDKLSDTELGSYQNGDGKKEACTENTKLNAKQAPVAMADGATPCCQYTL